MISTVWSDCYVCCLCPGETEKTKTGAVLWETGSPDPERGTTPEPRPAAGQAAAAEWARETGIGIAVCQGSHNSLGAADTSWNSDISHGIWGFPSDTVYRIKQSSIHAKATLAAIHFSHNATCLRHSHFYLKVLIFFSQIFANIGFSHAKLQWTLHKTLNFPKQAVVVPKQWKEL